MRTLITSFTSLILIVQTSQTFLSPDDSQQQLVVQLNWIPSTLRVGTIFKYCPFSETSQYGNIQRGQTNSYLLYLGFDQSNEVVKFIHYVSFETTEKSITHILKFNLNNNVFELDFVMNDQKYEGVWYQQYIYYDQNSKEIVAEISSVNSQIQKRIISNTFFEEEIQLIYGGSYKFYDRYFNQDFLLSDFPGKLKMVWLETEEVFSSFFNNQHFCDLDQFSSMISYQLLQNPIIALQATEEYDQAYHISFWSKVTKFLIQDGKFTILDLQISTQAYDLTQITLSSLQLQYTRNQNQLKQIIYCYSYEFPFVFADLEQNIQIKELELDLDSTFLQNWHFISITYVNNEINLLSKSFTMDLYYSGTVSQVKQFTSALQTAKFGQVKNDQQITFEIASVNYLNCYAKFIKSVISPCHYSCLICFGPFENQCSYCAELSNRILDPISNTCKCKMWYLDVKENICIGNEEVNMKLTKVEVITENFKELIGDFAECQFGYFQFNGNCYPCPSASQDGIIFCSNCIQNPNTWIFWPFCQYEYSQFPNDLENVYGEYPIDFELYLLLNEELKPCDYCDFCTEYNYLQDLEANYINCFIYPEKHINQITYIKCSKGNFNFLSQKCEIPDYLDNFYFGRKCQPECGYCFFSICQYCKDPLKFYFDWNNICRPCKIQNCKYCFQYNKYDLNQVSTRNYLGSDKISRNEEDFVVSCSLCYNGYIFDFLINKCIPLQINSTCENGFRNFNGELICTSSNQPRSLIDSSQIVDSGGCQPFFQYCDRCMSDNFGMISCIQCQDGYYLNFQNGICMSCDTQLMYAKTCAMETSTYDSWRYEVMSFYNHFLPDKIQIILSGLYYVTYYNILQCQDGYSLQEGNCSLITDSNCLIWNVVVQLLHCQKCNLYNQGFQSLSFFDDKCQICPYPCVVCSNRESEKIFQYNPYFKINQNSQQQSYKCILNINSQTGYINSVMNQIQEIENQKVKTVSILEREIYSTSDDLDFISKDYLLIRNPITLISKYIGTLPESPINQRENFFSLKNSTLVFEGQNQAVQNNISIYNQSKVVLQYYSIIDEILITKISSKFGVEIQLKNIQVSNIQSDLQIFLFHNVANITIENLVFNKVAFNNVPCFLVDEIFNQNSYTTKITIQNIEFQDCLFNNSSLIQIKLTNNLPYQLSIRNILFQKCQFSFGKLIDIPQTITEQAQLIFEKISFTSSNIISSTLLDIPSLSNNIFSFINFTDCILSNSIILKQSSTLNLKNVFLSQCSFMNSRFFILESQDFNHMLMNFKCIDVSIDNLSLFELSYRYGYFGITFIRNFTLNQIHYLYETNKQNINHQICLFEIQSQNIEIEDFNMSSFSGLRIFCFDQLYNLSIKNLAIENHDFVEGISSLQQGLLIIQDFNEITIINFKITNTNQYNNPLIEIISNNQANQNQSIYMSQVSLTNNQLIKNQINQVTSFIQIQSEFYCKVEMVDVNFFNNTVTHLIEDSQTISPALIFVEVKQSVIILKNTKIIFCNLKNSPNSLLYLDTDQIVIVSIDVQSINTQDALLSQSEGGVGQIFGAAIFISDGYFQNIYAGKAGCFSIVLFDIGLLNIQNSVFQTIETQNSQIQQSIGGVLIVDASNSILNLNFRNLQLLNIMSRDAGGFLFLTASSIENRVDISNVIIKNTLSSQLSLFGLLCDDDLIICQIQLSNITIKIDSSFYEQFLQYSSENQTNLRFSKMIFISSRKIIITNFILEGILPSSGLHLAFTHYLRLNNIIVKDTILLGQQLFLIENNFCKENFNFMTKQIILSNVLIQGTATQISQQDSILILKYQITNQLNVIPLKIHLNNFHFINNTCLQCTSGLVSFQFDQIIADINLGDIVFLNNKCGQSSCLSIFQNQLHLINSISIQNGQFVQNIGSDGILKLNVENLQLKNLIFLKNSAFQGGAIFMENQKISISKYVYFLENKATIAGAVFIKDSELGLINLQSMFFFANIGTLQVNNVQEEPQNLMMSIFNIDVETISSSYIGIPNLQKYQNENFLFLPSGQTIQSYKLFNQKELNYQNYDLNLKFYMISILGEKLNYMPDQSSQCKLNIIQLKGNSQTKLFLNYTLKFDAEESIVTFSDITLTLDPYFKNSSYLTLQIECDISSQKKLLYEFNVKGFKCQMGEYYFESQCLECDSTKGYYSFEPKSSICLKVDPVSIAQNTANQIELNPGYWRPAFKSSDIVKCIKNTNSCQGGWAVGDNSCKLGYLGGMCEECDIYNIRGLGQYFLNSNFRCQFCENYAQRIVILLLVTLLTLYSTYLTINSAQIIFLYFRRLKYLTFHYRIIFRLGLDQSAALIKMIVNYFQILNAINQFQLDSYESIFGILNPFSNPVGASFYSFDCLFSQQSSITIIYISLIVNIFGPIFYYLLFITIYLLIIFFKKIQLSVTIYLTAFFYLLFYTQPSIFKELGGLAAQRSIASIIYINQNVQYLYYTATHKIWLTFFIIPMLLFLGVVLPMIILYILFKNRKYFNSEKVRKLWGYLFNDYQEKTFYWEIVRIFQRQIIILALTFYQEQIIIKGCFIIIILIIYYAMVQYFRPYNIQSLNMFELQSIFICGIIIAMSCLKYTTQESKLIAVDYILSFLFLGVFFYFLFRTLAKLLQVYYLKYAERFNHLKLIVLKNFPQLIVLCPQLKTALRQKNKQIIFQRFQIAFLLLKNFKNHPSRVQNQSLQIRPTQPNEQTSQLSVQFNLIENQDRNLSIKLSEQQAQLF